MEDKLQDRLKVGDIVWVKILDENVKCTVEHVLLPMADNPYLFKGLEGTLYEWGNLENLVGQGNCVDCKYEDVTSCQEPCDTCCHIQNGKYSSWFPLDVVNQREGENVGMTKKYNTEDMGFFEAWDYIVNVDSKAVFACKSTYYKNLEYDSDFYITEGITKERFYLKKPEYKKRNLASAVELKKPLRPVGMSMNLAKLHEPSKLTENGFFIDYTQYVMYAASRLPSTKIEEHVKGMWEIEEVAE